VSEDIRDAFFDRIYELAVKDKDIFFISADADAFSLRKFKKDLPDQFINVGVAEQNMALVATGLALAGKRVFIYSITPFIAMRCLEQIKVNICSMNLPVAIVGLGSGYSFSYDGPTHHATQDIAIMRTLPEVTILNPCDTNTAIKAAEHCCLSTGPTYVRIDKGTYKDIYNYADCENGIKEYSAKSKIKIISTGYMTHKALEISQELKFNVDVVDLYRFKPLPEENLVSILQEADYVYTLEENTPIGGLGSIVSELITDNEISVKLKRMCLDDKHEKEFGSRDWLIENSGLKKKEIKETIMEKYNEYENLKR
jgi:transketolase